jgi:hypothetical protein
MMGRSTKLEEEKGFEDVALCPSLEFREGRNVDREKL